MECEKLLTCEDSIGGFYKYMLQLARILPLADFVSDVAEELLLYSKQLQSVGTPRRAGTSTGPSLQDEIQITRNNRVSFFNTGKGCLQRSQSQ